MGELYRLSRPLYGSAEFRLPNGVSVSEFAALLLGVKPVLFIDTRPSEEKCVSELLGRFSLKRIFPEELYGGRAFHLRSGGSRMTLIGRDLSVLERAGRAWTGDSDSPAWGESLGYPPCCVRAYTAWADSTRGRSSLVRDTAAASGPAGPFHFGLNNAVNYFSRLFNYRASRLACERVQALNRKLGAPISGLHVASWHPCSYRCAASLKKARLIFNFLRAYLPARAALLKETLARPVLYLGDYEFAFFRGRAGGNAIEYSAVSPPASLLHPRLAGALGAGDRVETRGRSVLVSSGGRVIFRFTARKAPLVLDFSGE